MSTTWKSANIAALSKIGKLERQQIEFTLLRAGILKGPEANLFLIIYSYSTASVCCLDELAYYCQRSRRTVQRYLKKLQFLGLIDVSYRAFKKLTIRIVDRVRQKELVQIRKAGGFVFQKLRELSQAVSKKKKFRHAAYVTNLSHSNKKETINTKKDENEGSGELGFVMKSIFKSRPKSALEIMDERNRQIAALRQAGFIN